MADLTTSETTGEEVSSPEPAPQAKVTRARATTSDVPRRIAPSKADKAAKAARAARAAANDKVVPGPKPRAATTLEAAHPGSVEIHQGGIANAQADDITVRLGGVALARADRLSVEMGGVGVALAREAHVTQGMARTVVAQDVRVDQGLIGTAFAGKVTFEKPSGVFLLLAGKTEGPVKAVMDWRGALAFGAAFGLLVGVLRRR
jgi:hypothetical protein